MRIDDHFAAGVLVKPLMGLAGPGAPMANKKGVVSANFLFNLYLRLLIPLTNG